MVTAGHASERRPKVTPFNHTLVPLSHPFVPIVHSEKSSQKLVQGLPTNQPFMIFRMHAHSSLKRLVNAHLKSHSAPRGGLHHDFSMGSKLSKRQPGGHIASCECTLLVNKLINQSDRVLCATPASHQRTALHTTRLPRGCRAEKEGDGNRKRDNFLVILQMDILRGESKVAA